MDVFDHPINKRGMNGFFPVEKLYPSDIEAARVIDFDAQAEEGMKLFSELPELFTLLFVGFSKRVAEIELLNSPEYYNQKVNYFIN